MNKKGVIVGSTDTNFCELHSKPERAYFLGLWCADGYHRTSSIGLSSISEELIVAFRDFLLTFFLPDRLRLRVYLPLLPKENSYAIALGEKLKIIKVVQYYLRKAVSPTIHLYVNSRPFLRLFREARKEVGRMNDIESIVAYFAGRFDGDGSIARDGRSDCRIVYSNEKEALVDQILLTKIGMIKSRVYHYKDAHTYCLYISRYESPRFMQHIREYSQTQKLVSVPSRDLIYDQSVD